ncbi:hypothetical protein ALX04_009235 [Lactiplantibacillus plantarum subsp. plantarum]|nr:hypothetical protein ALX04_009235 [Lactiplantibacillus plantarum subsp. plantarum]AWL16553.1 hypothetical protein DHT46_10505 [Lactiplantibacillus plantarum]AYA80613.1 hypothetical protein DWG19_09445 [Lactiplantibacillus plantarum]AYC69949.1 hypothetical protein D5291_13230 [Lactiplantibacillus plantarum]AYC73498.1 hypothetical protein D5290_00710 [Lactiplantibacillus plantarum]
MKRFLRRIIHRRKLSFSAVWSALRKGRFIKATLFLLEVMEVFEKVPLLLKVLAFILQAAAVLLKTIAVVLFFIANFLYLIVSLFYFVQNYMEKTQCNLRHVNFMGFNQRENCHTY